MDNAFKVHVSGITKSEYMAAARWLSMRKAIPIMILVVAATLCLLLFGDGSPNILLFPVLVAALTFIFYEYSNLRDFKKFPRDLEMDYEIDQNGWRLYVMDSTGICAWANTLRMRETKEVFLLYNSKTTSNLLPKRCLTEAQIEQVRTWYRERFTLNQKEEQGKEEDLDIED